DAQRLGVGFETTAPAELEQLPSSGTEHAASRASDAANRLATQALDSAPQLSPDRRRSQPLGQAWAVSMEVHNAPALRDVMGVKAWRALLRHLFLPSSKDPALRNAEYVDLDESRLSLYFLDQTKEGALGYVRAAQAVQSMLRSGVQSRAWMLAQFPEQKLPVLRVLISLHFGPIEVLRVPLDYGGERDSVVGATADAISRMRLGEPRVLWRVLGTAAAVAASPSTYRLGAQAEISIGSQELKAYALQGMNPAWAAGEPLDDSAWI
ncbi:MAG: hypothetical protein ACKO1L_05295, partial [Brachymonas sp.]